MKVTLLPAQMAVELAEIDTEGVTELAVIEITLDVAVGVVMQLAFDVMITVTWSPLTSELVVKVDEFVPALTPFNCH